MESKRRVLWIEDAARGELAYLTAPVYMDGGYDLIIAETISEAISYLEKGQFQVVIFDIRLFPGDREEWMRSFQEAGSSKIAARLGLKLLYSLFLPEHATVPLDPSVLAKTRTWLRIEAVGILTVEDSSELKEDLSALRLSADAHRRKTTDAPRTVLLDLINAISQPTREQSLEGIRVSTEG